MPEPLREVYRTKLDQVEGEKPLREQVVDRVVSIALNGEGKDAVAAAGEIGRQMQACEDQSPIRPEDGIFTLDRIYSPQELSAVLADLTEEEPLPALRGKVKPNGAH